MVPKLKPLSPEERQRKDEERAAQSRALLAERFGNADRIESAGGLLAANDGAERGGSIPRDTDDREHLTVDVALVDDNPVNARRTYRPETIARLATELKADGQLVPAVAIRSLDAPGRFVLIDGHYRKKGTIAGGLSTLRLEIVPCPTRIEMYRLSFKLNQERTAQTPLDNAMAWQDLLDRGDVPDRNALMAITGLSKQLISKTLKVLELDRETLDRMATAADLFSYRLCYTLAQISEIEGGPAKVAKFVDRVLDGEEIPTKELTDAIDQLREGQRTRKQRETSRQYPMGEGGKLGKSKVWDNGRMLIDIKVLDAEKRDRIMSYLQTELGRG